jgi:hypothetical protein
VHEALRHELRRARRRPQNISGKTVSVHRLRHLYAGRLYATRNNATRNNATRNNATGNNANRNNANRRK